VLDAWLDAEVSPEELELTTKMSDSLRNRHVRVAGPGIMTRAHCDAIGAGR